MESLKLVFFAALKEVFGEQVLIEISETVTVSEILEILKKMKPGADDLLSSSRFAIGGEIVENEASVSPGKELMVLPPSSGG